MKFCNPGEVTNAGINISADMRWVFQSEGKFLWYPLNRKVSCRLGHEGQTVRCTPLSVQ